MFCYSQMTKAEKRPRVCRLVSVSRMAVCNRQFRWISNEVPLCVEFNFWFSSSNIFIYISPLLFTFFSALSAPLNMLVLMHFHWFLYCVGVMSLLTRVFPFHFISFCFHVISSFPPEKTVIFNLTKAYTYTAVIWMSVH